MPIESRVDPRLRVFYLAAIAVGVFFFHQLWQVAIVGGIQVVLWLALGLGPKRLLRQVSKLWGFALFITASYALTAEDPAIDRWIRVSVWRAEIPINVAGAVVGIVMIARVLTVVLASQVARAGDSRAI